MGELCKEICKVENLLSAWAKVKEKGSAGGIDKVTIETFETELDKNLNDISEQLSSYHYIPEPYQEIRIPKDDNELRSLSLPTIKDKIVQQAVKDIIEPILDKEFLDVSYAYRQNKGPAKAIGKVSHLIANEKREWVTLCDIDGYFDTIHHDMLFSMLSERINWEAILKAGLNPYISYLHKPQDRKPTLVFDLIEEFRQQAVDRSIFSLITKGEELEIEKGFLTNETKKRVAEKVLERIHAVEVFRTSRTGYRRRA